MHDARSSRGASAGVVDGPRTRRYRGRHGRRNTLLQVLSLGCFVLGIGCIGWALTSIRAESAPSPDVYSYSSPPSNPTVVAADQSSSTVGAVAPKKTQAPRKIVFARNPSEGDTLGRLSIPALSQTLPIIEGTGTDDLKKGIGHYAQSVLPGQNDNCVLSGHRDTFFSRLGELKKGDRVTVETASGTYVYEVQGIRIVDKHDRTVIVPTDHGVLTLSTCYPFNYIGPAPRRYIVSADLVASK